jgi:ABC-type sugar transport system ATPase subunit
VVVVVECLLCGAGMFIFDLRTRGIDMPGRLDVAQLIDELAWDGKPVLFISS